MNSANASANSKIIRKRIRLAVQVAIFLALLTAIISLFLSRSRAPSLPPGSDSSSSISNDPSQDAWLDGGRLRSVSDSRRTPEQIVSDKVLQFGKHRRQIVLDLAERHNEPVPDEVLKFFDAIDAGDWTEADRLFQLMAKRSGQYDNSPPGDPKLNHFWPAVLETYGVAEQAHNLPAAELLKFGEDILSTVPPGAVYIGGTDSGRFIPTLIAETSAVLRPVVLTQNALIDSRYLEYIQYLYGDRLALPTQADAERLLAEYTADATKRLEHDEQFPDQPKQVRHLEKVERKDGKVEVGGNAAVMGLNQRLLQLILEKNPELSFILQESFPLKETYAEAAPAGPVMQLRARDSSDPLPQAEASKSVDYWRSITSQMTSATHSDESLKNYSHMAVAHGNLLAHNGHSAAAEQTYQLSLQIYSRNIDTVLNYHQFLLQNDRAPEASHLLQNFKTQNPDLESDLNKWLPPQQAAEQLK